MTRWLALAGVGALIGATSFALVLKANMSLWGWWAAWRCSFSRCSTGRAVLPEPV